MACRGFERFCTRAEARTHFDDVGLTYADINQPCIMLLLYRLADELQISNRIGETSVNTMFIEHKFDFRADKKHKMRCCSIYMGSHYFRERSCIDFLEGGEIRFCGWADDGNTNPVLRAFVSWCDEMAAIKRREQNMGRSV